MRTKIAAMAGFALLTLAPAAGWACEYDASTSASATKPAQLASAPEASRVPASLATSSSATKTAPKATAKQVADKSKEAQRSDVKVVALTAN